MVFRNQAGIRKIRLEVGNHVFIYLRVIREILESVPRRSLGVGFVCFQVLREIPESVPRRSLGVGMYFSRCLEKSRNLCLEGP